MSLIEITVQPIENVSHFDSIVTLEGLRYRFAFYTCSSGGPWTVEADGTLTNGGWYFDIANDDETAIVRGVGLVGGLDLLYPYRHLDVPPGALFVRNKDIGDAEADGKDPGTLAFIDGCAALYYLESE